MGKFSSRRSFLKKAALGLSAAVAAACTPGTPQTSSATNSPTISSVSPTETLAAKPSIPVSTSTSTPVPNPTTTPVDGPTVVHIRNQAAVKWNETDPLYWKYADQEIIDSMMDRGVILLTNEK
ncbi:twin-arginine translocation signal domain-containing protein, partial [bacterium]|nr:twin-arginine translocation signal domain-containing protein [bacterium]